MNEQMRYAIARALKQIEEYASQRGRYIPYPVDVEELRRRLGMSQRKFARRFGFPVATVRHWELRDRRPSGAALVLLNVIDRNSQAVLGALTFENSRRRRS